MIYYLLILFIAQIICSIFFHKKQNRGGITGGPISWPKALWLFYAIFSWYLVPIPFLFHPEVATPLKWIVGFHLLSWWIRGPLELVMIYKTFSWTPRYGIGHDIFHNVVLLIATISTYSMWTANVYSSMAFAFISVTFLMICFEVSFASLFLKIRGPKDHKIYYADKDPKWLLVNRLTTLAVVIGIAHQLLQMLWIA